MKRQMKKLASLLGVACLFNGMIAGCSSTASSAPSAEQAPEVSLPADSGHMDTPETTALPDATDTADPQTPAAPDAPATAESNTATALDSSAGTEGKWHVLPPEVAAAIDADFAGEVRKVEENSFYIAEELTDLLDDGSLLGVTPSPDAAVPDSELVPVVYDENTHIYLRTIYEGSESYEDTDASFQDIEKDINVELKGHFENDVFYADTIRIVKVA